MTLAALALTTVALASGSSLSVKLVPPRARPGDAFLVVVRGAKAPPESSVAGRALAFYQVPEGYAAVAGLPVETPPGPLPVAVSSSGRSPREVSLQVVPPGFAHRQFDVEQRFVAPPPPEVQRRIDEDKAAFAAAFAQPPSPPLFATAFALPRRSRVTGRFGEERTLNGVKPSQHYGLDLQGKIGAPVTAANAGRVVLVRDCWASGLTVVLWHGASLYTTYLHLSRALVSEGARVARGERIGLVGQSGRASGPHLHWGTKVGDLYVDPESVLRLPLGGAPKPATSAARAGR